MKGLKADVLHALRLYMKTPVSSLVAVAILAAGMAVVAAFLSLWNDLGWRPHPGFEAADRLVTIGQSDGRRFFSLPGELVERMSEEAATLDSVAGTSTLEQHRDPDVESEALTAELVTSAYFPGLRPRLRLGRPFDERDHDPDAAPVVILSHAFWQNELDGRRDVLGETLQLWSRTPFRGDAEMRVQDYRIVGVLAPELPGTFARSETSVWHPREQVWPFLAGDGPGFSAVRTVARLAPDASVQAAQSELDGRFADALDEFPVLPGARLEVIGGIVTNPRSHRDALRQIRLFLAGSVLLALVAGCNVSLFLLSRAPGRRRELAIRMAVGAPLKRLGRQLVTESSLLVVAATAVGLVASIWVSVAISELAFLRRVQWRDVTAFDWRVLGLVAGFMLVLTVLVSLAPVASLGRIGMSAGSRGVTARPGWGQRLAGTAQVAVASVIGACAVAFVWYLAAVSDVDRGFSAPDVLVMRTSSPDPRGDAANDDAALQDRERRRNVLGALPGVEAVAFGTAVPGAPAITFIVPAAPADDPQASFSFDQFAVDPAYFDLLGLSLIDGRTLEPGRRDEIVVNETLARRLWGRTDVVGELVPLDRPPEAEGPLPEVVGVVEDVMFGHPSDDMPPTAFRLLSGSQAFELILLRSSRSAADIRQLVQARVDAGELGFEIESIEPVEEAWSRVLAPDRARTALTLASAVLVLVLTAFGYFGTQRFLVAAGRREFAILAAVGAGPRAIGRLVLGRGLRQGLPGLVLGSLLAFVVVAWLRDDFFSRAVPPAIVTVLVAAGIAGVLLAATLGPARQARGTQPAPLLREE